MVRREGRCGSMTGPCGQQGGGVRDEQQQHAAAMHGACGGVATCTVSNGAEGGCRWLLLQVAIAAGGYCCRWLRWLLLQMRGVLQGAMSGRMAGWQDGRMAGWQQEMSPMAGLRVVPAMGVEQPLLQTTPGMLACFVCSARDGLQRLCIKCIVVVLAAQAGPY